MSNDKTPMFPDQTSVSTIHSLQDKMKLWYTQYFQPCSIENKVFQKHSSKSLWYFLLYHSKKWYRMCRELIISIHFMKGNYRVFVLIVCQLLVKCFNTKYGKVWTFYLRKLNSFLNPNPVKLNKKCHREHYWKCQLSSQAKSQMCVLIHLEMAEVTRRLASVR